MAAPSRRRISWAGLAVFLIGVLTIVGELRLGLMKARTGMPGHVVMLILGTCFLLIGLQFVVVGLVPALTASRGTKTLARNRFYLPVEGRVACGILIVLFVGAMIGRNNLLLLVFALLAAPFILNGFATFTLLQRMDLTRRMPDRAEAGRPVTIDVRLQNKRRWLPAWLMTVRDEVRGTEVGAAGLTETVLFPNVTFARVPARRITQLSYRLRLPERGRYRFGPAQLNTRFPIGLVERGLIISVEDELLVHPRVGRLSTAWRRRLSKGTELVSSARRQAGSFDDDFHRVREYQQGDDPRAIHWPTTARRGELIVREFRESRDRPLAVLIDLYRPDDRLPAAAAPSQTPAAATEPGQASFIDWIASLVSPRAWLGRSPTKPPQPLPVVSVTAADARVELALDLAATLAVDHLRNSQQSHVFCGLAAAEPVRWDSSTRSDLGGLMDRMAVAQPHADESVAVTLDLIDAWRSRRRRSEQVVWITTRPEAAIPTGDLPPDLVVIAADADTLAEIVHFA